MAGYLLCFGLCLMSVTVNGFSVDRDKRNANPRPSNYVNGIDVEGFLVQFGYMDNIPAGIVGDELRDVFSRDLQVEEALKDYQYFHGLPETGIVDRKTETMMKRPRCGVSDIEYEYGTRKKRSVAQRFTHLGTKWKKNRLTWKLTGPTRKLPHSAQKRTIQSAFNIWEEVVPMTIRETSGEPDIEIFFARGEHNDGKANAFDGRSRVLAHAFGPGEQKISGDAHFDDDEKWTLDPNDGSDMLVVAAHEFGHSLGLGHSREQGALMFPAYISQEKLKLGYDDIRALQTLYGSRIDRKTRPTYRVTTPRPRVWPRTTPRRQPPRPRPRQTPRPRPRQTPRPRPRQTPRPRPRQTPRPRSTLGVFTREIPSTTVAPPQECTVDFDAILEGPERFYYAVRQGMVFKFREEGLEEGYPKRTDEVFQGAPADIDMAFSIGRTSRIYLLKDNQVWRYTDLTLDEGFPLQFNRDHFPETPRFVISLIDDRGTSRVIMFGEMKWWFYNFDSVQDSIPLPYKISTNWRGVPRNVQYSVRWKDNHYYLVTPNSHVAFDHNRRVASEEGEVDGMPKWMDKTCATIMATGTGTGASIRVQPLYLLTLLLVTIASRSVRS